jgi:hypothetical protein
MTDLQSGAPKWIFNLPFIFYEPFVGDLAWYGWPASQINQHSMTRARPMNIFTREYLRFASTA